MRKLRFLFILSVMFFLLHCKKSEDKKVDQGVNTKPLVDSIKYSAKPNGNKLSGILTSKVKSANPVDDSLAGQFFLKAENGVLKKLIDSSDGSKKYFDTYDVSVATFVKLYDDNKNNESVGLQFNFIETDKDFGLINIPSNYKNFLYMIAVPVDIDGIPVGTDKYVIFNLKNSFDINSSKIKDEEYEILKTNFTDHKSEIYDCLKKYFSRKGKGNTISVFYPWGDIRDNINKVSTIKKYDKIKFKIAEIISIKFIRDYIKNNPHLNLDPEKYNFAYSGRENQLTIIGEFYSTKSENSRTVQISSNSYFDMGDLRP